MAFDPRRLGNPPASRRPLAFTAAFVVLLVGILPAALMLTAPVAYQPAWTLQALCVAVSGVGVSAVLTTDRLRPMQLCFWVFGYVWLGLAPLAMLTRDTFPWPLRADPSVSTRASLIVLVGMLGYAVAVVVSGKAAVARPSARPGRQLSPERAVLLAVASLAIAVLLVPRLGGVGAFFESREASNDAAAAATGSSGGAEAALAGWGLSVPAFWALLALLFAPFAASGWQRTARRLLLVPVIALNLVVNNPISQPRYWAGTVLIALVLCSRPLARVHLFRALALTLLVAVVIVFPSADYFRYDARSIPSVGVVTQLISNPDYDAYQQVQGGVLLVQDTGYHPSWGVVLPFFWVPRAGWPDKPRDAGPQIAEHLGYQFTNLSSPLWIESYLWGGLGSVLLVFGALGALSGRLDIAYDRARRGAGGLAATLVPPLALYQFIVLRGSLLQAMAALSLLLVVPLFTSRRTRKAGSPAVHHRPTEELAPV